jgi:acyl-CoA synthetase (AMP-forming)/AMP-acid ligase II
MLLSLHVSTRYTLPLKLTNHLPCVSCFNYIFYAAALGLLYELVCNISQDLSLLRCMLLLVTQVDLSHLRLLSCGGSPQSPTIIARAIAALGCEFFVSYGMTECCGKISMSILPTNWQQQLQQAAAAAGDDESAAAAAAEVYGSLLGRVCTSGRPFMLMEVSVFANAWRMAISWLLSVASLNGGRRLHALHAHGGELHCWLLPNKKALLNHCRSRHQ